MCVCMCICESVLQMYDNLYKKLTIFANAICFSKMVNIGL